MNQKIRRLKAQILFSQLSGLLLLMLGLGACTSGLHKTPLTDGGQIVCSEPRPQICTMDYRPVCALTSNGDTQTYANGCTACADNTVTSHRTGICE